jgi:NAD(P) transhydrogenase subunit beta
MNVLLAEANVPYSQLYELEQINPDFPLTDVALVVGANDVVNPDARDNPGSPISGMPILEVDRAKSVVVLKRGQGRGFSGLENPLFFKPNCGMLYGDAKETLTQLVQAARKA